MWYLIVGIVVGLIGTVVAHFTVGKAFRNDFRGMTVGEQAFGTILGALMSVLFGFLAGLLWPLSIVLGVGYVTVYNYYSNKDTAPNSPSINHITL